VGSLSFAVALVVVAALAWDAWRRWLIARSTDLREDVKRLEAAVLLCAKSAVVDAELARCAEEIVRLKTQSTLGRRHA